jgi:hypothetical protein
MLSPLCSALSPLAVARRLAEAGGGDPHWASVVLLLHCDGADGSTTFADSSASGHTLNVSGNLQIDTDQAKFGGASALLDGSVDYMQVSAAHADFEFGTGDFTIEMWVRFNATHQQVLCDYSSTNFSYIAITPSTGNVRVDSGGSVRINAGTTAFSTGQWYHLALTRNGGTWTLWRDGVQYVQTTGHTTQIFGSASFAYRIGARGNGSNTVSGHLDDVRVTKGVCRYTSNFTPPTAAFPDP